MHSAKRVIIATLSGVLAGLICNWLASMGPGELDKPIIYQILTSRALIGVAIGISSLKLVHWAIHGSVMGFVFSLPLAFSGLMAPESPDNTKTGMFIGTIVLGMIYGLMIEAITSWIFKARAGEVK